MNVTLLNGYFQLAFWHLSIAKYSLKYKQGNVKELRNYLQPGICTCECVMYIKAL